MCTTTITTVDYLLIKSFSRLKARESLHRLLEIFEIAPVNRSVIEEALQSKIADFEDAVLSYAGNLVGVDAIITRNTKDFQQATIKALDPIEFLSILQSG